MSLFFLQCSDSQRISESIRISQRAVNGVFVKRNGALLVVYGDPENKIKRADMVLFTHFRRDVIWAGRELVQNGSQAVIPAEEKSFFTRVDSVWEQMPQTRFHDYYCQTTKIASTPFKVEQTVKGGEILPFQDLGIRVLRTPGYTRGSVSYIMDIDGKRFAFTGDLIYGDGKIFDLYSFQDSLRSIGGYHGYAVRLGQLVSSLQLIASQRPDYIIPSRGPVITDPDASIQKLIQKVRAVYRNYLSMSAYRWYYPERMKLMSNHVLGPDSDIEYMPFASVIGKDPPSWYMHISNTNLVLADDSSAFLIDCGAKGTLEKLVKLKQSGRLKGIDGIFITHYHDDHTNYINSVVKEFGCPVYATTELKNILENPGAFDLPCLTTESIRNLNVMQDGLKMTWKDFTLTFRYFPGQTLYHDALLFEKKNGESIFFIGDSFTPTGIDDYCLLNRNLLHPGTGYFHCLDILKELPENILLSNQHVEPLFSFSGQQLDRMKNLLLERSSIIKDLFPWDNANYGIDEQWVSIFPYLQRTTPGETVEFTVKIFNHSDVMKTFKICPQITEGFKMEPKTASIQIMSRTEGGQIFRIKVPDTVHPGVSLMLTDIKSDNCDLHEWSEAMIEVLP